MSAARWAVVVLLVGCVEDGAYLPSWEETDGPPDVTSPGGGGGGGGVPTGEIAPAAPFHGDVDLRLGDAWGHLAHDGWLMAGGPPGERMVAVPVLGSRFWMHAAPPAGRVPADSGTAVSGPATLAAGYCHVDADDLWELCVTILDDDGEWAGLVVLDPNELPPRVERGDAVVTWAHPWVGVALTGDVDGDGWADLSVRDHAADVVGLDLYPWAAGGEPELDVEVVVPPGMRPKDGIIVADVDGDGAEDLLMRWRPEDATGVGPLVVEWHRGPIRPGLLASEDADASWTFDAAESASATDLDGDGVLELQVTASGVTELHRTDGPALIGPAWSFRAEPGRTGLLYAADVDADGIPDAVTTTFDATRLDSDIRVQFGPVPEGDVRPEDADWRLTLGPDTLGFAVPMYTDDGPAMVVSPLSSTVEGGAYFFEVNP